MLYTKAIEEITYGDVEAFCAENNRESIHLDYKASLEGSIARTIAAMANTWGGLVVVGVDEVDSRPRIPIVGIEFREHLREQVNNIILGNITPPVFPEIQVCQSPDHQRATIVIRVPQSNLTPHAIRGNTRVYVRTDTSNEPEQLATIDRLTWLSSRREKSIQLREMLLERADERWKTLCERAALGQPALGELTLSCSPLYPFDSLVDYRRLLADIPNEISVAGWGTQLPPFQIRGEMVPGKDGAIGFFLRRHAGSALYEEFNQYGAFIHREDVVISEGNQATGIEQYRINMRTVLSRLDLFVGASSRLYERLGFWGLVLLRIHISDSEAVRYVDLPPPMGHFRFEEILGRPADHEVEIQREMTVSELVSKRADLVSDITSEIGWAVGFPHITADTVRVLLAEAGRA